MGMQTAFDSNETQLDSGDNPHNDYDLYVDNEGLPFCNKKEVKPEPTQFAKSADDSSAIDFRKKYVDTASSNSSEQIDFRKKSASEAPSSESGSEASDPDSPVNTRRRRLVT